MPRRIWLTADTHFGHQNIIPHCERPFTSVSEMDETLITNWNNWVQPDDDVWHLGDFAWKKHAEYLARLKGRIHLINGNHDKMSAQARGMFASTQDMFIGSLHGGNPQKFFLLHYPLVSWPRKAGPGATYHLYGHVHGRYDRPGEPALDVGVDCHHFAPVLLEDVIAKIEAKMLTAQQLSVPIPAPEL